LGENPLNFFWGRIIEFNVSANRGPASRLGVRGAPPPPPLPTRREPRSIQVDRRRWRGSAVGAAGVASRGGWACECLEQFLAHTFKFLTGSSIVPVKWSGTRNSQGWPKPWANFKTLIWIFSQTAAPTCEFWVNPVNFRSGAHTMGPNATLMATTSGGQSAGRPSTCHGANRSEQRAPPVDRPRAIL
jgi:hypothetical protein